MFKVSLILLFFCFVGLSEAFQCFCTCCHGEGCTLQPIGVITGATACSCDPFACIEAWPNSCPTPFHGSSVATWSGKSEKCPIPWAGRWKNDNSACLSHTNCCCLNDIMTSTQDGRTVIVRTPVAPGEPGGCGILTEAEFYLNLTSPTASTASLVILGNQHIFLTRKGKSLTITNDDSPECSSTATCLSGDCMKTHLVVS